MEGQPGSRKWHFTGGELKKRRHFSLSGQGNNKKNKKKKAKVFVGLSGGVDSSVSAALLKEAGYDVVGVFIKVWTPDFLEPARTSGGGCTWREDRLDAMRVCAKLGIPFITLDLEKEYKREVVDYMISEYKAGRTPNPDVMCNKHVKFGAFFDWAMKNGADFVATGHYARVGTREIRNSKFEKEIQKKILRPTATSFKKGGILPFLKGVPSLRGEGFLGCSSQLLAAKDQTKDQSYFLWTLTQKQLSRTLFPVGGLIKKTEVRKLAEKFGLPTAEKKDSQGLCFIGKVDMKEFLEHYIKQKRGKVFNENGKAIGEHNGAAFFTLGERHGFKIFLPPSLEGGLRGVDMQPHYVISKDLKKNTITVSHKNSAGALSETSKEAVLKNVNWIAGRAPDFSKKYLARARYRQPLQPCRLIFGASSLHSPFSKGGIKGGFLRVIFDESQNAITPGQSLVIYEGDVCLGGGIIK